MNWELIQVFGLSEIPHIERVEMEMENGMLYISLADFLPHEDYLELFQALEDAGGEWLAEAQAWEFSKEYQASVFEGYDIHELNPIEMENQRRQRRWDEMSEGERLRWGEQEAERASGYRSFNNMEG